VTGGTGVFVSGYVLLGAGSGGSSFSNDIRLLLLGAAGAGVGACG